MSPLARSLLALAALLAAADANGYNCVTKTIGQVTSNFKPLSPVVLPYGYSEIQINDYCAPLRHVGERITVCNNSPNQPKPIIHDPPYGQLSPAGVDCSDASQCTADPIVEYCG
ncbi:uncharacterized protein LOC133533790 [Cydia pomonella]|uniref:uncharacterized protein LOC133533790 n=1 Tax=Cydia pomonella TaxID=82600 RepID=UPI002ADDFC51|nr:uncharacterized protein LOC133533790 [Cydia pomonella]